tara:strand:- start:966 stop:2390 length:1425 start_codon:yes stop_codon:yes gene_type:complete
MNFIKKNYIKIGSISIGIGYYIYNKPKQFTYQQVYSSPKKLTTYKNGVYDITNFIESHPGGKEKILEATNRHLEPYWNKYQQHLNPEVLKILETMKIGELSDYDPDKFYYLENCYNNEPIRDKKLLIHTEEPCNAETPKETIHTNPITPNNLWYIRNHNPVPNIKPEKYKLTFFEKDKVIKTFNLEQLKKLPSKKIITTIQCGGNRRNEYEHTIGTQWDIGAISTAEWEGVPLHDLLKDYNYKHIHLIGYDGVKVSIPFKKGASSFGDVILAYKMNGEELPRDHGYPVRVIVPGYVGIRNIKWIQEIILEDEEIDSSWQKGLAYKILPGSIRCLEDVSKINLDDIDTINELPIQSCITYIEKLEKEEPNGYNYRIHGYAYSSKPFEYPCVNVSIDGGITWNIAGTNKEYEDLIKFKWSWCLWGLNVKIDKFPCNIICKAMDTKCNVQPKDIEDIWNIRGLSNNSVHKVNLEENK